MLATVASPVQHPAGSLQRATVTSRLESRSQRFTCVRAFPPAVFLPALPLTAGQQSGVSCDDALCTWRTRLRLQHQSAPLSAAVDGGGSTVNQTVEATRC